MKITKKFVTFTLAMTTVISALSGCGTKEEDVIKLDVWSHDSHSKTVVLEIVDEWNKTEGKEMGVEIVYTVKEGNIQQATEMAFASQQGPDLFTSVLIEKNRAAGNIIAIEDIAGGKEWIEENYTPEELDTSSFKGEDGKIYCLPYNVNAFGLVYNKDMFKKYGIVDENGEPTPPETFEEVREYAKIMTNAEEQDYGIILPMKWGGFYSTDVNQLLIGSTGKTVFDCVKGEYNFDGLKPIYEMYVGLKEDGSCFPGSETLDNDMARAYFAERNIGMKFAGSFDVGVFNSQFPAKCDWGVAPYPTASKDEKYLQHMGVGGYYAMSKACYEKLGDEKALKVLKFLYSPESIRKLYAEGMAIPYNSEVIEGVEVKEGLKGWKEFAEIVSISTSGYKAVGATITGEKNAQTVFMEDVWAGNVSVDDAIADLNERFNIGMKKYLENHPEKKLEDYIKPDWNIKRN